MEYIALREIEGQSEESDIFKITVGIGMPYLAAKDDWVCQVLIDGLDYVLPDLHGIDSWQVIQLARNLIIDLLEDYIQKGGKLFLNQREIFSHDLRQAF